MYLRTPYIQSSLRFNSRRSSRLYDYLLFTAEFNCNCMPYPVFRYFGNDFQAACKVYHDHQSYILFIVFITLYHYFTFVKSDLSFWRIARTVLMGLYVLVLGYYHPTILPFVCLLWETPNRFARFTQNEAIIGKKLNSEFHNLAYQKLNNH